jgi:hypothetical protein
MLQTNAWFEKLRSLKERATAPTARRAQAGTGVRARGARKGARVDTLRPCVA